MTDRVALVTGGSSGIGEQAALRLRGAGFTTYAVARRVDRMSGLADAGVTTFAMDVSDDASMAGGIERVLGEHGRIDVLVNNAGYGSYGAVENVPIEEGRRQFEVYEPLGAWYHATKFAVEGFSDSLRLELAPYGIRVVIVEPGPIRTEWNTIARDGLVASSAGTAYESQAEGVRARMESGEGPMLSSGPDVVAKKILRAATARRPRSRYPVGRGAGSIVTARRLLPDRALDAVIGRLYS
jgi:NAD(P)-dependent dehydrogenase (short-subunit alcohol dehydrogenase family)